VTSSCLFCAIAAGDIPADIVHRDEEVVVFRDIDPQAPVHLLVIPTSHHDTAGDLATENPALAGVLLARAAEAARVAGVSETGYRIVTNTGSDGGQSVQHVHFHVLGGRGLTWPPG
jgi:histidine triad (HIT) family protein